MLLAVDIGNTNIVAGIFDGSDLKKSWRLSTESRTADEYGVMLTALFSAASLSAQSVEGAIISSVVPKLNCVFRDVLGRYLNTRALVVGEDVKAGMPVLTERPTEVGADRIVNAVAAYSKARAPVIVVDLGTAATFDYVTGKGEFMGGAIAPGINISADALFDRTAKLPRVDPLKTEKVIGRNTVESMQSGLYWGFVGMVDGIIDRMKKEIDEDAAVIATGGLVPLVNGVSRHISSYDEFLTLKGLRIIYKGNE